MAERISWDEYFSEVARTVAKRTSCIRRAVGVVIVAKDHSILATGYNGSPRGMENCCDIADPLKSSPGVCRRSELGYKSGEGLNHCVAVHGEVNAIVQAARTGQAIEGATMYVTHQPCSDCTKIIIAAGISEVVFLEAYAHTETIETLTKAGINVRRL